MCKYLYFFIPIVILFTVCTLVISKTHQTPVQPSEAELTVEFISNDTIRNYVNLLNETILRDNFYSSKYVRNVEGIV